MARPRAAAPVVFGLALAACGEGGGGVDAAVATVDAPPRASCAVAFDEIYILTSMNFFTEEEGEDLTGDGAADNALGFMAPLVNQAFRDRFVNGLTLYLFAFSDWDEPRSDDPEVAFELFAGADADDPPDTTNNFGGAGEFLMYDSQLDVECRLLNRTTASVTGGLLEAVATNWDFRVEAVGSIDFSYLHARITFDPGYNELSGTIGTVFSACGMGRFYLSPFGFGSFLGVVAGSGHQPDIDADGDGLERIETDGEVVTSCTDGDGTVLDGVDCPCDPRIADGYSSGASFTGIGATLVGIDNAVY